MVANLIRSYFRLFIHAKYEPHHPLINIWLISNWNKAIYLKLFIEIL